MDKNSFWQDLKDRAVKAMQLFNLSHSMEDGYATSDDYDNLYN